MPMATATMTAAIESLRSRSRASGAQSNDLCLHVGWREEKMCVTQKACLLDCSFVYYCCLPSLSNSNTRERARERKRESKSESERARARARESENTSLWNEKTGAISCSFSGCFPFWDSLLSSFPFRCTLLCLHGFVVTEVVLIASLSLCSLSSLSPPHTQHSTTTTWTGTRTAAQPVCTVKHTTAATENNRGQQPGCRRPGADESGMRAPRCRPTC